MWISTLRISSSHLRYLFNVVEPLREVHPHMILCHPVTGFLFKNSNSCFRIQHIFWEKSQHIDTNSCFGQKHIFFKKVSARQRTVKVHQTPGNFTKLGDLKVSLISKMNKSHLYHVTNTNKNHLVPCDKYK